MMNAKASKLVFPGNKGLPEMSSGIMHPRAQISTDFS
jgi:hypothetical protein